MASQNFIGWYYETPHVKSKLCNLRVTDIISVEFCLEVSIFQLYDSFARSSMEKQVQFRSNWQTHETINKNK